MFHSKILEYNYRLLALEVGQDLMPDDQPPGAARQDTVKKVQDELVITILKALLELPNNSHHMLIPSPVI